MVPIPCGLAERPAVVAGRLSARMHTQETMDAILGKNNPPELCSPRNGILLDARIERYFDAGKFAIVPEIGRRSTCDLKSWFREPIREYKTGILDPKWKLLDEETTRDSELVDDDNDAPVQTISAITGAPEPPAGTPQQRSLSGSGLGRSGPLRPATTTQIPSPQLEGPAFPKCHHRCMYAESTAVGASLRPDYPLGGSVGLATVSLSGRSCV